MYQIRNYLFLKNKKKVRNSKKVRIFVKQSKTNIIYTKQLKYKTMRNTNKNIVNKIKFTKWYFYAFPKAVGITS